MKLISMSHYIGEINSGVQVCKNFMIQSCHPKIALPHNSHLDSVSNFAYFDLQG